MNKEKKTNISRVQFIGAAIKSGQDLEGVEKGPTAIRQSGLFKSIAHKYNAEIIDHEDISLASLTKDQLNQPEYKSHVKRLHLLDPLLEKLSKKV